jgi:Ca2+-binding EF-hand superfamily protein
MLKSQMHQSSQKSKNNDKFKLNEGDIDLGHVFIQKEGDTEKRRYRKIKRRITKVVQIMPEELDEIKSAFQMFDKDKSGAIDVQELRDALNVLGIHMEARQVKEMMDKADKDGSGTIEIEEFVSLMAKFYVDRSRNDEIRKIFRNYDDDDNGMIEVANLRNAAVSLGIEVSEEELVSMIEVADPKKNGYVDLVDFLNLMERSGLYQKTEAEKEKEEKEQEDIAKYFGLDPQEIPPVALQ